MLRKSAFVISWAVIVMVGGRATAQTVSASDFQQWTQVAVTAPIKQRLSFTGFGEARVGNYVSQFDEELLSAGITYSPSRWISIGTGYLFLHANPNLSGLNYENRIYAEATLKAPAFRGSQLSDRVRPELRWLQTPSGGAFTQRYRNRVMLERPVVIHRTKYTPFVMWEDFYDTLAGAWSRTRLYAGFTAPVTEQASIQLYFMHQDDQYFRPYQKNAIGVSLLLRITGAHRQHPDE